MSYILFFVVIIVACLLIHRVPFIKKSGLSSRLIIFLFLFKILAGVVQAYITGIYFPGSDTWGMNNLSYSEYQLLLNDTGRFFRELYISNYNGEGYDNLFGSFGSFWNDLEINLITKGLAPFNFVSSGNYYINSIFFNFFGFFGHIALFRLFNHIYNHQQKLILAGCFLLPTFLFFSSAIGKDNIAFTMLAMYCFCLYFFTLGGFNIKKLLWLLFFFIVLLLMRNHIALLLLPPAFAFYTCIKTKKNSGVVFGATAVLLIAILAIVPIVFPSLNPGAIISQKQKDFIAIGIANTQINVTAVEPSTTGLLKNLPEAFMHGFFRPYLTDVKNSFTMAEAIEILLVLVLFIAVLYKSIQSKTYKQIHPFILFCIFFCTMVFIMNGYIAPNYNTLVRYRSIYLPLIIIPALCSLFRPKHMLI